MSNSDFDFYNPQADKLTNPQPTNTQPANIQPQPVNSPPSTTGNYVPPTNSYTQPNIAGNYIPPANNGYPLPDANPVQHPLNMGYIPPIVPMHTRNDESKRAFRSTLTRLGLAITFSLLFGTFLAPSLIGLLSSTGIFNSMNSTVFYIIVLILNDMIVYLVPIVLLCIFLKSEIWASYKDNSYEFQWADLLLYFPAMSLLGSIGSLITNFIAGILNSLFGTGEIEEALSSIAPQNVGEFTVFMLFVCVFGPISEEFIYRKLMLNPLRRYGDGVAVFITSLCFGLTHGNFDQFAYAFIVGLVLGMVAVKANSIKPTIALHIINNTLVSVGSYITIFYSEGNTVNSTDALISSLVGILNIFSYVLDFLGIAALIILITKKMFKLNDYCPEMSRGEKIKSVILHPAMIVAFALYVSNFFI